jgi:hypothetical protein
VSPEQHDVGGAEYADRVRAWAAALRAGSTQVWREFRDGPPAATGPSHSGSFGSGPLPGAAQLELVRRLSTASGAAADLPDFGELADLVLATSGPGRGLVDVPLPWPGSTVTTGTPPVDPDALPPAELIRAATGVLVPLIESVPLTPGTRPARSRWPWRRGFTLLGAPTTVALVRSALLGAGLREGGPRSTYFVLGGPLDDLMAQRWAGRVRAGAAMRWSRMWRAAQANDRLPPGIALPTIAAHLADEFGADRVHVVLANDPAATLAVVAGVLRAPAGEVLPRSEVLATDLLRRLNPPLTLAVGEKERRRLIDRVWPEIAGGEEPTSLGVPAAQFEWAVACAERMTAALATGRYAVHGDPALVVPVRRPGVRRAPDPEAVLTHALTVVGRAWRAGRTQAAGGRT